MNKKIGVKNFNNDFKIKQFFSIKKLYIYKVRKNKKKICMTSLNVTQNHGLKTLNYQNQNKKFNHTFCSKNVQKEDSFECSTPKKSKQTLPIVLGLVTLGCLGLLLLKKGNKAGQIAEKITDEGVKLADGTIRFKSEEGALKYAQKVVTEKLQGSPEMQKEVGVTIRGCDVLEVRIGGQHGVAVGGMRGIKTDLLNNQEGLRDIIFVHGHPDLNGRGITTPLSSGDLSCFRNCNIKTFITHNSTGEINRIDISDLEKFFKTRNFYVLEKLIFAEKLLPQKDFERFRYLHINKAPYGTSEIKEEYYQLEKIIGNKMKDLLEKDFNSYCNILHNGYKNQASEWGLKYTNTFSHLK